MSGLDRLENMHTRKSATKIWKKVTERTANKFAKKIHIDNVQKVFKNTIFHKDDFRKRFIKRMNEGFPWFTNNPILNKFSSSD